MTKNAKIAVVVSILAVIVAIVVLSSTIFSVDKAQLIWYNTPVGTLASLDDETILKASQAEAKSVFLLDREKTIKNIEAKYPQLRVINVEIAWPNVMKIHAIQRQEVYAIQIANGKFAILDEYLKVLNIVNTFNSSNTNAVLISSDEYKNKTVEKSDTVTIFGQEVYLQIYDAFLKLGKNLADVRAIIASAEINETTLTLHTHFGLTILLDKPFANTNAKMRMALKTFDLLTTEDYKDSVISVFVNNDNQLEANFYKEQN